MAAELVLTNNLATEVSDRTAADTALDTAYKAADAGLQTQISNIIQNTDATALNSLAEIVAEFQSSDSTLTAAVAANGTAITNEVSRATTAEGVNTTAIAAEAVTARAAEQANASAITSEAATRLAADNALDTRVTANEGDITTLTNGLAAEISATNADISTLTTNLSAEVTRAGLAEAANATDINAEATTRASADTALDTRVTAAEGSITNIISNTDAAALDSLTEIVNAFTNADSTLTGAVAANTTQVATNVTDIATNVTAIAARLPLAGGTMSGDVDMDSNMITGLGTASASSDAVSLAVMQAAITAQDISVYDTDDLAEGSNQYFTPARARAAISVTDVAGNGLASYDSSTGVISINTNESVLDLTDVSDNSYTGKADFVLQVKADESGMELADPLEIFTSNNRQTIPGDGSATTYSLTFTTDQANSMVFVGGVIQDPSTHYTINSSAQTITFASALPVGTQAVVVAHQNGLTPVLTSGQVTTDILAADIKAYVQGSDVSASGATTIDTFNGVLYRSAKYIIQVDDGAGNYETREALVVHDGTTAYITEFAMVYTGTDLIGDASVTMSGNNVQLQYTPTSGTATVKVIATYIDV